MDREALIYFGGEVKAVGDGKVAGYLVRYGTETDTDADGEFFTAETDFGASEEVGVYYHHGLNDEIGGRRLGKTRLVRDAIGVWVEAQLAMRDEYERAIYRMAQEGKLGWSSGAVSHLVRRIPAGKATRIAVWPIGEASLTPTPAEMRNAAVPVKSLPHPVEALPRHPSPYGIGEQPGDLQVAPTQLLGGRADQVVGDMYQPTVQQGEKHVGNSMKGDEGKINLHPKTVEAIKEIAEETLKELVGEQAGVEGGIAVPSIKRVTRGYGDEGKDGFLYWLKTGDAGAVDRSLKAVDPLESTTNAQGAVTVPDDLLAEIIGKRDEASVVRAAGARVIQTSLDTVNIPTENASQAVFAITAQEAAVDEDEPTFSQVAIPVYKFTKLVKATVEIMDDNKANLEAFLQDSVGRAMAATENKYFLVGTGTGQPQGVMVGGTAGLTFASATAIASTEIPSLRHKLAPEYAAGGAWVTRNSTLGAIRGLTGNIFQFAPMPMGDIGRAPGAGILWDLPAYQSDQVAATTTGQKSIVVGNFHFYGVIERQGLAVQRLSELYAANGYVGLLWSFRIGGAVLQAEAFQYGTQA